MSPDFEDLLRLFNDSGARYLIVGGHAVMLYTEPRYTKDLDIWIDATEDNAVKVFGALARFGAPLAGLTAADFACEGFFYQLGVPPVRVDVLMSIEGVRFGEAWPNRVESSFGNQKVFFIGKSDLLRNKRASGRLVDLHDAEQLESWRGPSGPGSKNKI